MIEIYHVSDLHFGQYDFQTRKAKALLKQMDEQEGISSSSNKYLLVTGDITDAGADWEYDLAVECLSPFRGKILVIPGNHDYAHVRGSVYSESRARDFDDVLCEKLNVGSKYFDKIPSLRLLPNAENPTVMLAGLNSNSKQKLCDSLGFLSCGQIRTLQGYLDDSRYRNLLKIVYLHHIPCSATQSLMMDLIDWEELWGVIQSRADVVAFGHEDLAGPKTDRPMNPYRISGAKPWILDANNSVNEYASYRIRINDNNVAVEAIFYPNPPRHIP